MVLQAVSADESFVTAAVLVAQPKPEPKDDARSERVIAEALARRFAN